MTKYTDKQVKDLIRQAGDQFTLSASHKTAMRFHLMDVIKSGETRTSMQHTSNIFSPRRFAMPLIPIIVALVLAIGGGTATLANTAKPGDALYPVDQLIEQIQEKLTTSPEAKTELLAKFADERVAELSDLEKVDSTKLTETAKQLWEEHRQEAIDRVTTSIARVTVNQDKFKERLATETDATKKAVLEKIIAHLDEVKTKREAKLTDLQTKTFPGLPKLDLKKELEQAREEHKQEIEQIREQAKQEWEKAREARKQAQEKPEDNSVSNSTSSSNKDEDKSTEDSSNGSTSGQTTLEMRVPYDPITGEINWDLLDTDHDGIPDKYDPYPDWGPHTMTAKPQA